MDVNFAGQIVHEIVHTVDPMFVHVCNWKRDQPKMAINGQKMAKKWPKNGQKMAKKILKICLKNTPRKSIT